MKIKEIDSEQILFDNGDILTYRHIQDCCEINYADFKQIDDIALKTDFDKPLTFQRNECGFRFGNLPQKMFFVPCYSEQNGYYSNKIEVIYSDSENNSEYTIYDINCEVGDI